MTNSLHGVGFFVDSSSRWRQSQISGNKGLFSCKKIYFGSFPNIWLHGDNSPFPDLIVMNAYLSFAIQVRNSSKGVPFSLCSPSLIQFFDFVIIYVWRSSVNHMVCSPWFPSNSNPNTFLIVAHSVSFFRIFLRDMASYLSSLSGGNT